jgi:hypothetical protein
MILRKFLVLATVAATFLPAMPVTTSVAQTDAVEASLLSKGKGTQTFIGGGLTYGTVAKGGRVEIRDIAGDLAKTVPGLQPRKGKDGSFLYVLTNRPATFKLSGTKYEIVLNGVSTLNGIGVYGKAAFKGVGTYQLSGDAALLWDGPVSLGKPTGRG